MTATTDLPTLMSGFRLYCLAEGKLATTTRWYLSNLKIFLQYLQEHKLPTDVTQLTITHLRAFLVHLRENVRTGENNPRKPTEDRNLSPRTIQVYARALKAFFSWLVREGYTANNPARLLSIPKAPKVIVETQRRPDQDPVFGHRSHQFEGIQGRLHHPGASGHGGQTLRAGEPQDQGSGTGILQGDGQRCAGEPGAVRRQGTKGTLAVHPPIPS